MTNAIAVYDRMNELQLAARALQASGYFSDIRSEAQAIVKVMAGAELGLPPFASMSGIHIVNGKPTLGANLIATLVKNDPRYNYRVKQADDKACTLTWYEDGQPVGESSFTMTEATAAGLTGKQTWKAYPSDMLFARALTRGARRFAPGIFGGAPVYTPEEMGVETDEDGVIIPGEVVRIDPPANGKPAATTAAPGPLPDDEMTIHEAPAAEFLSITAALLDADASDLKARLKALGYSGVPGDKGKRLAAYRALKAEARETAEDALYNEVMEETIHDDDEAEQDALFINTDDIGRQAARAALATAQDAG